MASVREQLPPHQVSLFATIAGVVIGALCWHYGAARPMKWVSTMDHNNHETMAAKGDCYGCHVPQGPRAGLSTKLDCLNGGCHGELDPNKSFEQAVREVVQPLDVYAKPQSEEWGRHTVGLHAAVKTQTCQSCHPEHRPPGPEQFPPGFTKFTGDRTPPRAGARLPWGYAPLGGRS